MHPYLPLLLTAGVERHIIMHSPTSTCPCAEDMQLTPTEVRELPGPNVNDRRRMIRALTSGRDPDDDENTIALFDEYVSRDVLMLTLAHACAEFCGPRAMRMFLTFVAGIPTLMTSKKRR